ncbi:darobactin export ABC transporter periplasmic adaptor subunit [Yersinia frederiksenii]|uniref:darobactin export ABC transporter periplasmic adaptor subunit n=1 Tax=Yersinia frederiksenii TaxID=29484 RepID=UPI0025AA7EB0|nr:darobactin export ABC transporter periplasmic adaptor subunit [Yersinia frederiksenii]MDN0120780.1 darobactin export ABC transporter periplasmic adaptor subunit [Yersinia frederiksenii]
MDIKIEKKASINKNAKLIIFCVLLLFISGVYSVYYLSTKQQTLLISRDDVIFHTIKPEVYQDLLITRAITVPKESIIVSSERGGKVINITKQAFDTVAKGDVIANLSNYDFMLEATSRIATIVEKINNLRNMKIQLEQDNRDTKISLQEAEHQIAIISKDLNRHRELDKKSMIAKSELEYQVGILKNWQAKIDILRAHDSKNRASFPSQLRSIDNSISLLERMMKMIENGMDQLVITAPIDGTLSVLDIELGQQIKPGEKIAVIDNLQSYYFNVYFSEYYLDKIIPQSQIVSQINGQDIPLLIESVSTIVENGKFKAKLIPYQQSPVPLKRGQSIEIKISLNDEDNNVLLVPAESIISDKSGNEFIYIYQPEKDKAIKSYVEIRRRSAIKTEITAGLIAGQQIVVPPKTNNKEYAIIEFK